MIRTRTIALVAAAAIAVALGFAAVFVYRDLGIGREAEAVECRGSAVTLEFDPDGHIEARVGEETVAEAHVRHQRVNTRACDEAQPPGSYSQRGVRYSRTTQPMTVVCRLPGRFLVEAEPVSASWSGERPAGTAVALVLQRRLGTGPGPRRTILASAVVMKREDESDLVYVRKYCAPMSP